jgi:hypothetical protein
MSNQQLPFNQVNGFLRNFLSLVSIMRNNTNIEIKYNNVEEDNRLDESKEEETPL